MNRTWIVLGAPSAMIEYIVSQCKHLGKSFKQKKRLSGNLLCNLGTRSAVSRLSVMPKRQPSSDVEGDVALDPCLADTGPMHGALTFDLSSQ
jgi:hypothetical protein